jgi:hypothetical protein
VSRPAGVLALAFALALAVAQPQTVHARAPMIPAVSYYPADIEDPNAVRLSRESFGAHGDGLGDDTAALQRAIDEAHRRSGHRLVLIPAGVYRLTGTVNLWGGVRLIGHGQTRPVLLLEANTEGFQQDGPKYLVHFRDGGPRPDRPPVDAKNTTFYSGIHNINIEIRAGNPAAVAVRFNVAQHCSLKHMDFLLADDALGVDQLGNEIEACRFVGGRIALRTSGTSAGWQVLLMDCAFEGQREAAIDCQRSGLVVIRGRFARVPVGLRVPAGRHDKLYIRDSLFEEVTRAAVLLDERAGPEHQFNAQEVTLRQTPAFLEFHDTGRTIGLDAPHYRVLDASHGLHIVCDPLGRELQRETTTRFNAEALEQGAGPPSRDLPAMPPQAEWVNIRALGATGDGQADDTQVFREAIERHRTIYLPTGRYLLSDTLRLRPDTRLIGLHAHSTQLVLRPRTPGFDDADKPRAVIAAPAGGENILTGFGINPAVNAGAVAVEWRAGRGSMIDDVFFSWEGQTGPKRHDLLYSLWVRDGGGGVFKNIWTASPLTRNGLYITNTSTPGRAYLVSVEHHLETEVELEKVENWEFYALQTEANLGGEKAVAVRLRDCRNLMFANLFVYRVMAMREPHPHAVRLSGCEAITFRGVHSFSWGPLPYSNTLFFSESEMMIPEPQAARIEVGAGR